jgi:hypothetical protein
MADHQAMRARHEIVRWMTLWHRFLVFSPSYELARKSRMGELTGVEVLPADFETVLRVYDDLGPVRFNEFSEWWQPIRFQQFGFAGDKRPSVERIGMVHDGGDVPLSELENALRGYHSRTWTEQGQPAALIAAIPLGLPKSQIMRQIGQLLDDMPSVDPIERRAMNARYSLHGSKLHRDSVVKYHDVLQAKSVYSTKPLWRIGIIAQLSYTYTNLIKQSEDRIGSLVQRTKLKELTSRAFKRGHMIAENAARGIFPSYENCPHAMALDLDRVEQQRQRKVAERRQRRAN